MDNPPGGLDMGLDPCNVCSERTSIAYPYLSVSSFRSLLLLRKSYVFRLPSLTEDYQPHCVWPSMDLVCTNRNSSQGVLQDVQHSIYDPRLYQ